MPLAALLIADDTALPRLLGADPVEFQLRRASAAGAGHAVIFAGRLTAPLLAVVDRLRRDGFSVDIARSVADVAEYLHPDEAVLMIAAGVVISPARLAAIAQSAEPILLCVRDTPANERFELIDPTARWTGFARVDGGLLRRTAAMVGDWDFGSTLMRRAVQEGAQRMTLTPEEAGIDIFALDGTGAMKLSGDRLIALAEVESAGWGTRWLIAPAARFVARFASEIGAQFQWITLAAFAVFAGAIACALGGWIVASLLFFLLGQLCDVVGSLAMQVGATTRRWEKYRFPVRVTAATIVAVAMGITLTLRSAQWGCVLLSVVTVGATWLAAPLARDDRQMSAWRSDPAGSAVIGLAGFAFAGPIVALAISAAHAAISLGVALRKAFSGLARP